MIQRNFLVLSIFFSIAALGGCRLYSMEGEEGTTAVKAVDNCGRYNAEEHANFLRTTAERQAWEVIKSWDGDLAQYGQPRHYDLLVVCIGLEKIKDPIVRRCAVGAYALFRTATLSNQGIRERTYDMLCLLRAISTHESEKEIIDVLRIGCQAGKTDVVDIAASNGLSKAVDFLLALGDPVSDKALHSAQYGKHHEVEKKLYAARTGLQVKH